LLTSKASFFVSAENLANHSRPTIGRKIFGELVVARQAQHGLQVKDKVSGSYLARAQSRRQIRTLPPDE
jgi:hypothetical protein